MKKIIILSLVIFLISGCGIVAKSSGDVSSSSIDPLQMSPEIIQEQNGFLKNPDGTIIFGKNVKVDALNVDRVYENEELDGPYKSTFTWYLDGRIQEIYYSWDSTFYKYVYGGTINHEYELYENGKLKKYVQKQEDGSIDVIKYYSYPDYIGTGYVITTNIECVMYIGEVAQPTYNMQIIINRNIENTKVTENYYENGVFVEMYCYNIM